MMLRPEWDTYFMGAAYWVVPEESRAELHSPKLAYAALSLWTIGGLTAVVGTSSTGRPATNCSNSRCR